ncbi:MAG: geranylgeranyl reductase family protein [Bacteroidetes bacterium]|nr:geranylgeranyl reductase family protein [Bacteroidota bacterium]
MKKENTILIIGAGPAGCACALSLAKKGIPSILIDKAVFPRDKICGDALSGAVIGFMNKIEPSWAAELGQNGLGLGSHGINFIAPSGKSVRLKFNSSKGPNAPAPGYVSKRIVFDNWLVDKVKKEPLIQLIEDIEIRKYTKCANGYIAESRDGRKFEADLIVACDGAYSAFAKEVAGLETEKLHNCFGIRAYYKNVEFSDPDNFIELHFIKKVLPGYFWIFQMPNGEFNVGMGMRADVLAAKKINLKKLLEEIVSTHPTISKRFANAQLIDDVKLWGLPLGSKKRTLYGDNYLLCGDAAMLIDPFTGEGIGNALSSGYYAAQHIALAIEKNDFSSEEFKNYQDTIERVLGPELRISTTIQRLANHPWLFNFVVNKIAGSNKIQALFSSMIGDIELRAKLKSPLFYWNLMFNK